MPRKRKNVEKIYKIISRCLIAVLLLCATLYYLIIGETDAPGFSHGDVYTAQDMEVHFIDVGQGDCTLLLCGESAVLTAVKRNTVTLFCNILTNTALMKSILWLQHTVIQITSVVWSVLRRKYLCVAFL